MNDDNTNQDEMARGFVWPKPQLTYPRNIKHLLRNMLYNGIGQLFDGIVCLLTFGLVNTWLSFELCIWISHMEMRELQAANQILLDEQSV